MIGLLIRSTHTFGLVCRVRGRAGRASGSAGRLLCFAIAKGSVSDAFRVTYLPWLLASAGVCVSSPSSASGSAGTAATRRRDEGGGREQNNVGPKAAVPFKLEAGADYPSMILID